MYGRLGVVALAALGAVVLAAVLIGRHCAGKAETVRSRQPLAGVLAFAGAVCFLAAAGAQLAVGLSATSSFVRSILECICAVWLSTLGRCWLTPSGWKKPTGGLYLAVAGSVLFYWNVLMRFMENVPAGTGYSPRQQSGRSWRRCCFWRRWRARCSAPAGKWPCPARSGVAAFCLCLCWELPRVLLLLAAGFGGGMAAVLPELLSGLALCCIGGMGLACIGQGKAGNN